MNPKHLTLIVLIAIVNLALLACGIGQAFAPTATPPPTNTPVPPTATLTPLPPTSTSTPVPPTATPQSDKQIKLIYMKGDKPTAGQEIWLSYYDENSKKWVTNSGTTDQEGLVIFNVPEGPSGESYTFTFAYSEADVQKHISQITDGKLLGFRIPPDPSQKSLTLKLYGPDVSVEDGAIQMWQPK